MVHMFTMNGFNFAVEDFKTKYSYEEIKEAYNEIKALKEQGLLFTDSQDIEEIYSNRKTEDSIKALCLHVSHDCSLSCEYAYYKKRELNVPS